MTNTVEQTIYLARHGTRVDHVNPEWRDTAARPFDPPLAEQGRDEAHRLAQRLADELGQTHRVACVYASPFLRTVQTAHPIAEALDVPLRLDTGAGEWLHPDWFEGVPPLLPHVAVDEPFHRLDRAYQSPPMRYPELWRDCCARAGEAAHRLAACGHDLVIIGHGASVKGMVAALRGLDPGDDSSPSPAAGLFKLVRHPASTHYRLELAADTSHLLSEPAAGDPGKRQPG